MQPLDFRDARPIYEQLADRIRREIIAGILSPGDRLPSVRETAAACSINPNTIQRSYRLLEQEGWIASVPGKGSFVCDRLPRDSSKKDELLTQFDNAAAALVSLGVSPMELIARLTRLEGDHHA